MSSANVVKLMNKATIKKSLICYSVVMPDLRKMCQNRFELFYPNFYDREKKNSTSNNCNVSFEVRKIT